MSTNLDQKIGRRLRIARKACGYKSARAFATKYSIPESTYSQHETGKRSLGPELLIFYSECLGIEPGWLVSGADEIIVYKGQQADTKDVLTIPANFVDTVLLKQVVRQEMPRFVEYTQRSSIENLLDHCLKIALA